MMILKLLINLVGLAGIFFIFFSVYLWLKALAEEDEGHWEKVVYCTECSKRVWCMPEDKAVKFCSLGVIDEELERYAEKEGAK